MLTASMRIDASSSITRMRPGPAPVRGATRAGGSSASSRLVDAGRFTRSVVPCPGFDSTETEPPWFLMIEYDVARPRPLPFCFVLKYGSKIRPRFSSGMPMPSSATEILT